MHKERTAERNWQVVAAHPLSCITQQNRIKMLSHKVAQSANSCQIGIAESAHPRSYKTNKNLDDIFVREHKS